ncbi:MAG: cytochrome-c oxidase, cbb3-type subunit III [Fimbriimonadaceae bacterium]|nr:cytochrome-c oxidase, cbb3-type subunit III [Alphaproteobacteria bacterium]
MTKIETDEVSGTETTGHQWDGIKELNTPLPRWWINTFYLTIVWSIGYWILYPAWPLISDATRGYLGYSSRAELAETMAVARADQAVYLDKIADASLEEINNQADLLQFAVAGGRSAFLVNCSTCHGSGAQGGPGYPNLNDDDWIWGGTLDDIYTTLAHGVRFETDDDTRVSDMPNFGSDEILEKDVIADTATYVRSLSGLEHDAAQAVRGAVAYADNCASCHGEDGAGDGDLGAPALNDAIWLYGSAQEEIAAQISQPRQGVMPAWAGRLDDTTIKQLAIYVHSLGGGE